MTNFTINFAHPWLLLVLIPALLVAFIPYFRLNKKYRRTRNRISSLVLHVIVVVLTTLVLAGLSFDYEIPKEGNEIILLVDVSESQARSEVSELDNSEFSYQVRDDFVKTALYRCDDNGMSVGVVTFGFDQNYCVPFTKDAQSAYSAYLNAELPDTSATDIASALNYARTLFHNPDTAKIVLITDGKETDGNAKTAIRNVLNQNTKVDFVNVQTFYKSNDIQVVDVVYPDYHVKLNEECEITAVIETSNISGTISVSFRDNGEYVSTVNTDISNGYAEVRYTHKFTEAGLHEMTFTLEEGDVEDNIAENNLYTSYYDLQNFNKILVIEGVENQSENLAEYLTEDDMYDVTVINLYTDTEINGYTVDDLRQYDQIILNNVSNYDLCPYSPYYEDSAHAALEKSHAPDGFDEMLNTYVTVYGGGILTVGGSEAGDQDTAHAYNRKDMSGTLYQAMLPVQAIDYTPPLGVVIVIDVSGSMSASVEGYTRLHWAKEGAFTCLRALSERDYVGIVTLFSSGGQDNEVILPLTARTQERKIKEAIESIGDNDTRGGTNYSGAIERAGMMLRSMSQVEKRHIIMITDGQPGESADIYEEMARDFFLQDGTTVSVVGLGVSEDSSMAATIESLAAVSTNDEGEQLGRVYYCPNDDVARIGDQMREDLNASDLKEVNYETYYPSVNNIFSPLVADVERTEFAVNKINATLDGYYGVKARSDADLVLTGNFSVPLYAQWKRGNGMVGSFMSDLNRVWSSDFMDSVAGRQFIINVIENLMPVEDIRPVEMKVRVTEDNYTNTIDIFDTLGEGEVITGTIVNMTSGNEETVSLNEVVDENLTSAQRSALGVYVRKNLNKNNDYSGCEFIIKESGVYLVTLNREDSDGNVLATYAFYKSFAYSEEYDLFLAETSADGTDYIRELAKSSRGNIITDYNEPDDIFKDFVLTVRMTYDPRYLFLIIAIVLFLLDIIVRKFKFKWPHEWFKKKDDKFKK